MLWNRYKILVLLILFVALCFLVGNYFHESLYGHRIEEQKILKGETVGKILTVYKKEGIIHDVDGASVQTFYNEVHYSYSVEDKEYNGSNNIKDIKWIEFSNNEDSSVYIKYSVKDPQVSLIKLIE